MSYRKSVTKIKKKQLKSKPFACLKTFLSQIVRAERSDIKAAQVAPCKILKHRHLNFMTEQGKLAKKLLEVSDTDDVFRIVLQ